MPKVLLVHKERYLDRALQDVGSLMAFEQQQISEDEPLDLLAVILLPPSSTAQLTSEDRTCELFCLADSTNLFTSDSVSVNGVWTLLTVRPPDVREPANRQELLSRVLSALQDTEFVLTMCAVFPVFSSEQDARLIWEQMAYLQREHPSLPVTTALSICGGEHSLAIGKIEPCSPEARPVPAGSRSFKVVRIEQL